MPLVHGPVAGATGEPVIVRLAFDRRPSRQIRFREQIAGVGSGLSAAIMIESRLQICDLSATNAMMDDAYQIWRFVCKSIPV